MAEFVRDTVYGHSVIMGRSKKCLDLGNVLFLFSKYGGEAKKYLCRCVFGDTAKERALELAGKDLMRYLGPWPLMVSPRRFGNRKLSDKALLHSEL